MSINAAKQPKAILARDQIDDRHKWNLADLYASDREWESDYKKAHTLIEAARQFAGRLAESPSMLYNCLQARSELTLIIDNLYQYARLNQDIDNRVSKYQALTERAATLASDAAAAFSFIEPELLDIDQARLLEMAAQFEKTDEYDFYIKELIRCRPHIRSQEVEELLAQAAVLTRGPDSIFTMLNDADLKYPSIKDENGHEVTLTKQRFAKFMESQDRRVRRDAHNAFYKVYQDHLNTLNASLTSAINGNVFYSRARHFESCLHAALHADNIPVDVYHSLLDTTESSLDGLNAYTKLRKRILNLDQIRPYDLICPLFPERDFDVTYDQAIDEILQALTPLGHKYCAKLKDALNSRWVDVYEAEGKGSGAYSWRSYTCHPFVLMNYNDTVDNMFTLAHEMGHAMHSFLSSSTQPYPKAQYSIFVAEVASTLNEGLLMHHLLKKATDKLDKLYLLNRCIDNTASTFFNQVMYARFELESHQLVEKGGALSPDLLSELWRDLTRKYLGPELEIDKYTPLKWSRVPHFYMTYYVYQYATSYAASQTILERVLAGDQSTVEQYLKLLAAGGSDYPIELLKKCGLDMTTADPIKATLRLFADQVSEMESLTR